MTTEPAPFMIPYQQQLGPANDRLCGAACLSMVYSSLGKNVAQTAIWPSIAKTNQFGSMAASTYLMTQDALDRGFQASAVQTKSPIQALKNCREAGIRVILNHLLEPGKPAGHYSVLLDIDDRYVRLHDPFFGAGRRLSHADLIDLWRPQERPSEIRGFVLIAVSMPLPASLSVTHCPACQTTLKSPPAALIAGLNICPACDHTWVCDCASDATNKKFDLSSVFMALDRFSGFIQGEPAIAQHPDVRIQMAALSQQKEKIRTAVEAFESSQKLRAQQLAAIEQSAQQEQQAFNQKLEQIKAPMQQLDGHALGLALLKSLGFGAVQRR